jgi:hypothetical protein
MRQFLFGLMFFVFASGLVLADVGPPPPQPPPPAGPRTAVIRGVTVEQVYTYWRGRRWMTVIDSCASSQAACSGRELSGCFIVGSGGFPIPGGDVAFLVALESSAGDAPIKLMLDSCALNEIELNR